MAPLISFGGIASGLDTNAIVAALSSLNQKPIALLEQRRANFEFLRQKYAGLDDKIEALRDKAKALAKATDFLAFTANSSNTSVLTATGSGAAGEGSFNVTVNSLARAEVDASAGFADFTTTQAGSGDIGITIGGTTHTISIASGAGSLEKIRDEINDADAGVTATIVSEGTGANPYRLVLQSDETGTENAFTIDLTAFTGTLSFSETQTASDAQISVNGMNITRSSNTISDVVPGVTLNLVATNVSPVTVTLVPDHTKIKARIQEYVDAHTELVNYINAEIKMNGEQGGPFNGESAVRSVRNRLEQILADGSYPGGPLKSLAQIGVKLQNDGTLVFDHAKFDEVVKSNLEGVADMLTTVGKKFDDKAFSIVKTPGSLATGDYAVSITQAATKAASTAGSAFASGGTLSAAEQLTLVQGTKTVEVDLAAGDDLAAAITKLNDAFDDEDVDLVATDSGGALKISAKKHGSAQSFTLVSDVASGAGSSGVGTSLATATGLDAQGTIGGVALAGEGQTLKGAVGTAFEGLEFRYTGTAAASSTLTIGQDGYFVKLKNVLDGFIAAKTGTVTARIDGLKERVDEITDRIEEQEERAARAEETIRNRFVALEQIMAKFQAQLGFLSSFQFPSLQKK